MTIVHLAILPDWNSLDSVRRAHSNLEAAGLVFFVLLVVMEALAHNATDDKRKHLFDSIGIWFFAVAIVCEIAGYWYGQRNDALSGQIISSLDAKAGEAFDKASKAHKLAQSASDIAGPAKRTADEAKREADSLAPRIAEMNGTLNALGPRSLLIENAGPDLAKNLSIFPSQRFLPLVCGTVIPAPVNGIAPGSIPTYEQIEKESMWEAIFDVLENLAKWRPVGGSLEWKSCNDIVGASVIVNSDASAETQKAAHVLSDELTKILPSQPNPMLLPIPSSFAKLRDDWRDPSPIIIVAKDPEVIAVIVGVHPIQPPKPPSKKRPK